MYVPYSSLDHPALKSVRGFLASGLVIRTDEGMLPHDRMYGRYLGWIQRRPGPHASSKKALTACLRTLGQERVLVGAEPYWNGWTVPAS